MLPALRQDLSLHAGPTAEDGSPTWMLHDPAANRFYRLSWPAFELLSRWPLRDPATVIAAVNTETTLQVDAQDLAAIVEFLAQSHLLDAQAPADTARLLSAARATKLSKAKWLLKNYLFLRIPLWRPARWLDRFAPRIAWVFQPRFWIGIAAAAVLGLYLASRQWDSFVNTFSQYGSWSGVVAIAVALSLAKLLHELGHAFTAQRYGCRVPSMGVAFLVLWPVLYTDTNEAWKLADKRQRLRIAAAGMLAELALAALATLAWNFLPDGPLRAGVFLLATTTWIFTLVINASPFMRFDGYFLLCDWLDMPNLHTRAFAFGRWWLRLLLFAWDDPPPEQFTSTRRRFLVAFAFATWLYRLALFLGIAWLVYHAFFKLLGIFLLIVEIGWFIAMPVYRELKVWWQRRTALQWNRATRRSTVVLIVLLAVFFLPLQRDVRAPAVIGAAESQGLYAVAAARVTSRPVASGTAVSAGQVLLQLDSPDLAHQLALAQGRMRELRWQLDRQSIDAQLLQDAVALQQRWAAAAAEVAGFKAQTEQLIVRAPFDGRLVYVNEGLVPGAWVAAQEKLLHVTGNKGAKGEVFMNESELSRLRRDGAAVFVAELAETRRIACRLGEIDRITLTALDSAYLASTYGGPLRVQTDAAGLWVPTETLFRARLLNCDSVKAPDQELRGTAHLGSEAGSLARTLFRRATIAVQRELGR